MEHGGATRRLVPPAPFIDHPPRRVVTGRRARIRWWHRVRAAVLLAVFVVGGGIALATVVGVTIFLSGFLVEQAIG